MLPQQAMQPRFRYAQGGGGRLLILCRLEHGLQADAFAGIEQSLPAVVSEIAGLKAGQGEKLLEGSGAQARRPRGIVHHDR